MRERGSDAELRRHTVLQSSERREFRVYNARWNDFGSRFRVRNLAGRSTQKLKEGSVDRCARMLAIRTNAVAKRITRFWAMQSEVMDHGWMEPALMDGHRPVS